MAIPNYWISYDALSPVILEFFLGIFISLFRSVQPMRNMGGLGEAMSFRKSNAKFVDIKINEFVQKDEGKRLVVS